MSTQSRVLKFRAPVTTRPPASEAPPKSEADVTRRSAESQGRGNPGGRPPGLEPVQKVGLSLTVRHLKALDTLAAERYGDNRSKALAAVLDGKSKLVEKKD
jgi:hypothetical protein